MRKAYFVFSMKLRPVKETEGDVPIFTAPPFRTNVDLDTVRALFKIAVRHS